MSRYTAVVVWERGQAKFSNDRYSRAHRWRFDGGAEIAASSSPKVVPLPMSDPGAVDPEEAFVAALSSCHMLWFLSIAARRGFVVERYQDEAEGSMAKDERGKLAITRVALRPRVSYSGRGPGEGEEATMHHEAHEACFIANSVRTEVVVEAARAG
jgi:organic hydroperoxide reductase OsmC/OhrA